jgi:hypothetical protein
VGRVASEFDMAFGNSPVEELYALMPVGTSRGRFGRSREDCVGREAV